MSVPGEPQPPDALAAVRRAIRRRRLVAGGTLLALLVATAPYSLPSILAAMARSRHRAEALRAYMGFIQVQSGEIGADLLGHYAAPGLSYRVMAGGTSVTSRAAKPVEPDWAAGEPGELAR